MSEELKLTAFCHREDGIKGKDYGGLADRPAPSLANTNLNYFFKTFHGSRAAGPAAPRGPLRKWGPSTLRFIRALRQVRLR